VDSNQIVETSEGASVETWMHMDALKLNFEGHAKGCEYLCTGYIFDKFTKILDRRFSFCDCGVLSVEFLRGEINLIHFGISLLHNKMWKK